MQKYLNERIVVLLALLLCAVSLFYATFTFDFSDVGSAHSPVFFPRIILVLWMGLVGIALVQTIIENEAIKRIENLWRLSVLIIATLVYSNYITEYGFFISSAIFAIICLIIFGIRNPAIVVGYAIIVPALLVILFNHLLGMPLPTSPFTHYF